VNDKDLEEILFPKNAIYYSKPNNPRGLDATILAEKKAKRPDRAVFNSITAAYQRTLETSKDTDFIYIGGSTFCSCRNFIFIFYFIVYPKKDLYLHSQKQSNQNAKS
jgi:folylpolyglutamate synthase/dihydropteroate synthase